MRELKLPERYQRAALRNAVYMDCDGRVGIGFCLDAGGSVFISLSAEELGSLIEILQDVQGQASAHAVGASAGGIEVAVRACLVNELKPGGLLGDNFRGACDGQ